MVTSNSVITDSPHKVVSRQMSEETPYVWRRLLKYKRFKSAYVESAPYPLVYMG